MLVLELNQINHFNITFSLFFRARPSAKIMNISFLSRKIQINVLAFWSCFGKEAKGKLKNGLLESDKQRQMVNFNLGTFLPNLDL